MRKGGKVSVLSVAPSEATVTSLRERLRGSEGAGGQHPAAFLMHLGWLGIRGSRCPIESSRDGVASQGRSPNVLLCVKSFPTLSLTFLS